MRGVRHFQRSNGFTLVELLVSMTVIAIMLVVLSQMTNALRTTISRTTSQLEEFRDARNAFETMTRRIGQATLNAYDDLDPTTFSSTTGVASSGYARASELRFRSGPASDLFTGVTGALSKLPHPTNAIFFQAPLGVISPPDPSQSAPTPSPYAGLDRLLNTCGYYIEWNNDSTQRPGFLSSMPSPPALRYRFRLMELVEPTENLTVYKYTSGIKSGATPPQTNSWTYTGMDWFQNPLSLGSPPVHVVTENVVLLALLPMVSPKDATVPPNGDVDGTSKDLAPAYSYDSTTTGTAATGNTVGNTQDIRNKLPPLVYVLMVAVDEKSFARFQGSSITYPGTAAMLGLDNILNADSSYAKRLGTTTTPKGDVINVTAKLAANHIDYRIFTAAVPLTPN